jgi:hypothetical protein
MSIGAELLYLRDLCKKQKAQLRVYSKEECAFRQEVRVLENAIKALRVKEGEIDRLIPTLNERCTQLRHALASKSDDIFNLENQNHELREALDKKEKLSQHSIRETIKDGEKTKEFVKHQQMHIDSRLRQAWDKERTEMNETIIELNRVVKMMSADEQNRKVQQARIDEVLEERNVLKDRNTKLLQEKEKIEKSLVILRSKNEQLSRRQRASEEEVRREQTALELSQAQCQSWQEKAFLLETDLKMEIHRTEQISQDNSLLSHIMSHSP